MVMVWLVRYVHHRPARLAGGKVIGRALAQVVANRFDLLRRKLCETRHSRGDERAIAHDGAERLLIERNG